MRRVLGAELADILEDGGLEVVDEGLHLLAPGEDLVEVDDAEGVVGGGIKAHLAVLQHQLLHEDALPLLQHVNRVAVRKSDHLRVLQLHLDREAELPEHAGAVDAHSEVLLLSLLSNAVDQVVLLEVPVLVRFLLASVDDQPHRDWDVGLADPDREDLHEEVGLCALH